MAAASFLLRIAEEVRGSRFETSSLFPIVFSFIVLDRVQLMNMCLSLVRFRRIHDSVLYLFSNDC